MLAMDHRLGWLASKVVGSSPTGSTMTLEREASGSEGHVQGSPSVPQDGHLHHGVSHISETSKDVVTVMKAKIEGTPEPPAAADREENDIERYDGTKFKRQVRRENMHVCVRVWFSICIHVCIYRLMKRLYCECMHACMHLHAIKCAVFSTRGNGDEL
jgi:hypothetical protein